LVFVKNIKIISGLVWFDLKKRNIESNQTNFLQFDLDKVIIRILLAYMNLSLYFL